MDNVLRLSIQEDPLTFDPQKSGDRFSSALIFLLFKGLTRFEADHRVTCDLASSFQVLGDHKKYIFHLGEHFWSDGTPITAHDFVYSWKRALHPTFPLRATNLFYYIKNAVKAKKGLISLDKVGVYAKNDLTLEVELECPCPYFLELTSFCALFPVSSRAEKNQLFSICSGPFQLHHWNQGQEILLTKNFSCSNPESVHIDGIHIKVIPDAKKAFTLFENDQLDWIGDPISPLPVNYLPALLWTKKIKPIAGLAGCWFNTVTPPFNNVKLRKAFAIAIPRKKLLEKLMLPNTLLAKRLCPSILQESEVSFSIQECPATARALFQAAQEELKIKCLKVTLSHEATDEFSRLAALLKAHWEEVFNVSIQLESLPFKELWQRLPQHEFEMSLFCSFSQYTDIISFLDRFEFRNASRNFSGWENIKYKELLQQYRKTAEYEKRQELSRRAEALLLNEMPIAPIYYHQFTYLQKMHVKNLSISPIGVIQFDRVSLEKKEQRLSQENSFILRR
ncbi:MAG: peptide ABC transporter substrate-binding protein [Rhabdochlamydiaceae bacterium]